MIQPKKKNGITMLLQPTVGERDLTVSVKKMTMIMIWVNPMICQTRGVMKKTKLMTMRNVMLMKLLKAVMMQIPISRKRNYSRGKICQMLRILNLRAWTVLNQMKLKMCVVFYQLFDARRVARGGGDVLQSLGDGIGGSFISPRPTAAVAAASQHSWISPLC
ncbi:uncharacterized protein LOC124646185 [Helicoverpa zea]|uniref:uncharacterized protein LOC124646185 n=1 Tax=Helicoverpa zea TaxID=7113 RepID=UPI001F582B51|nr:uncharacterized protein LOC124646185 [Helicoverpa zea]